MAKKVEMVDPVIVQNKARIDELIEERKSRVANKAERRAILEERKRVLTEECENKDVLDDNVILRIDEEIKMLMQSVPCKETKTMYKLDLLSGSVELKKAKKEVKPLNKKSIVDYLQSTGRTEFVKTTYDLNWAEFKSILVIQEGLEENYIIDKTTGEMLNIEGLSVVEKVEELVVK